MTKSRGVNKTRHVWTWAETELVRRCYADSLTADIARVLGLSIEQVYGKAVRLGLRKDIETISEISRIRAAETDNGHRFGFKKGHEPANKGIKRPPGWSPGRMRETQFQKGKVPYTWKPVGTLRVNADGYLDRKVSDSGYPPDDWKAVHRLLWVEANGPIPVGHVVSFKPGMRTTVEAEITLDKLELLSRRQLLDRNSIHNLPPQLVSLTQLRGALTRQINKRARSEEK